jgi:Flp pilus assembly protein TadG
MKITARLKDLTARLRRDRRGVAAVEFALVAPVLAGILLPMADLGIGAYKKMRVQDAAESGAQYALLNGFNSAAIVSAATNATSLTSVTATAAESYHCITSNVIGAAVTSGTTCSDGSTAGTYVSVNTQITYSMLISYPGLTNPMTLAGYTMIRIQ